MQLCGLQHVYPSVRRSQDRHKHCIPSFSQRPSAPPTNKHLFIRTSTHSRISHHTHTHVYLLRSLTIKPRPLMPSAPPALPLVPPAWPPSPSLAPPSHDQSLQTFSTRSAAWASAIGGGASVKEWCVLLVVRQFLCLSSHRHPHITRSALCFRTTQPGSRWLAIHCSMWCVCACVGGCKLTHTHTHKCRTCCKSQSGQSNFHACINPLSAQGITWTEACVFPSCSDMCTSKRGRFQHISKQNTLTCTGRACPSSVKASRHVANSTTSASLSFFCGCGEGMEVRALRGLCLPHATRHMQVHVCVYL